MRRLSIYGWALLLVFTAFVVLVSAPIVHNGSMLLSTNFDVWDYQSDSRLWQNPELTNAISDEIAYRQEMASSNDFWASFMFGNRWTLWLPVFIFGGIVPLVIYAKAIFNIVRLFKNGELSLNPFH